MTLVLIVVSLAGLLAAEAVRSLVLYRGRRKQEELRRRLRFIRDGATSLLRNRRIASSAAVDRVLRPLSLARWLEQLLLQTDLAWTAASVIGWSLMAAVGLTAALIFAVPRLPVLWPLGLVVGLPIPTMLIFSARAKRGFKLSSQLPDALDMVVRALRAGHGVSAGMRLVATEMPIPVASEFGRCVEEQQLGVEFREAVRNMADRVPKNLDLKILAVSLIIQHDTGGNLVEILDQISRTLRERFKFYGKLRALTAEGRYSGYILGSLPFACAGMLLIVRPGYLTPLVTDPLGSAFLLGGLILWVLGVLWMRRMVQVDV
jgi:tight adherence protein B